MELYEDFSHLRVDENLFSEVKFFVTGCVPDWILQLLLNGGGKQISHIVDTLSHLIVGSNPDENEIEEANEIYSKPAVNFHWITFSVKCKKLLPIEGFSVHTNQIFSGVRASLSKLSVTDCKAIWSLITFYGGICTLDLDHTCTHLIAGKPDGIKYSRALEKSIEIVTPDWVLHSIEDKIKQEEKYYHPRLLYLSEKDIKSKKKKSVLNLTDGEAYQQCSSPNLKENAFRDEKVFVPDRREVVFKEELFPEDKEPEKDSIFSSLVFSDDEEEGSDNSNLLNQLKYSQPWKKSPTPPPVSAINKNVSLSSHQPNAIIAAILPNSVFSNTTKAQNEELKQFAVASISRELNAHSPASKHQVTVQSITASNVTSQASTYTNKTSSHITKMTSNGSALQSDGKGTIAPEVSLITSVTSVSLSSVGINAPHKYGNSSSHVPNVASFIKPSVSIITRSETPISLPDITAPQTKNVLTPTSLKSTSEIDISYVSKQAVSQLMQSETNSSFSGAATACTVTPMRAMLQKQDSEKAVSITAYQNKPDFLNLEKSVSLTNYQSHLSHTITQAPSITVEKKVHGVSTSTSIPKAAITMSYGPTDNAKANANTTPPLLLSQNNPSINQPEASLNQNILANAPPQSASQFNQALPQAQKPTEQILNSIQNQFNSNQMQMLPQNQISQHSTLLQSSILNQQNAPLNQVVGVDSPILKSQMENSAVHKEVKTNNQSMLAQNMMAVGSEGPPNITIRNNFPPNQLQNLASNKNLSQIVQPNQIINANPNVAQQQVHSVAIPGAVVRLPAGVTQQQLQMMSNEERHKFLEQLHKKQIQEQLEKGQRVNNGKPYSPTPVMKSGQTATIHYQNNKRVPVHASQVSGSWPQMVQTRPRAAVPTNQQGQQVFVQEIRAQSPAATPGPGVSWQQGQAQKVVQVNQQVGGQPQAAPQQYVVTQGTTSRVITGQQTWLRPQSSPQQIQLQAKQLMQHFPGQLTQQECVQLIQTLPTHIREIQSRDNAARLEYLSALDPRERQIVNHFYVRKQQQQMLQRQQLAAQQQQQQQAQIKTGNTQQSPTAWQQQVQYNANSPHARTVQAVQARAVSGIPSQTVPPNQAGSPLIGTQGSSSPHPQSPVQRPDGTVVHPVLHGSPAVQNLMNQQNMHNAKTKTALANLLTNRVVALPKGQGTIDLGTHIVQKPEGLTGPNGEQVVVYQRRTLANLTGNSTSYVGRVQTSGGVPVAGPGAVVGVSYQRGPPGTQGAGFIRPNPGQQINYTMLPRDLCMVGCVFYIADYHADVLPSVVNQWKMRIREHGGEVVDVYDPLRVTHLLCKHQRSPVFQQAISENKRCITIYWLNDILLRGKQAAPWHAIHLPTPFDDKNKPMDGILVSITGFRKEERVTIKLMLRVTGAKYTGSFSKHNNVLICKKLEGPKISKAREYRCNVVNGMWLSEVLLGLNTPPLVYKTTRYQAFLEDPLRADNSSLPSYILSAWTLSISVSKETVDKAKQYREIALRKRKIKAEEQENKKSRLDSEISSNSTNQQSVEKKSTTVLNGDLHFHSNPQTGGESVQNLGGNTPKYTQDSIIPQTPLSQMYGHGISIISEGPSTPYGIMSKPLPKIILSSVANKEELEKKIVELSGTVVQTSAEATHLVMGPSDHAPRTIKMMCAISCSRFILTSRWINDSYTQGKFLREDDYTLSMPSFECHYRFSLKKTMAMTSRRTFFNGMHFYITPSVVPGAAYLKEIIVCAGGQVEEKRKSLAYIKDLNSFGNFYICIATERDSHLVKDLIAANQPVFLAEFILVSIMRQNFDFDEYKFSLEDPAAPS